DRAPHALTVVALAPPGEDCDREVAVADPLEPLRHEDERGTPRIPDPHMQIEAEREQAAAHVEERGPKSRTTAVAAEEEQHDGAGEGDDQPGRGNRIAHRG